MENNNLASAIKYLSDYEIQKAEILKRKEAEEAARRERELEAERERIRLEERRRILEEEEIKRKAEKETVEKLKEVDEEQARFLSSEESKKVIYTVVATEEELKDIEQAMTSFGVYFERKGCLMEIGEKVIQTAAGYESPQKINIKFGKFYYRNAETILAEFKI